MARAEKAWREALREQTLADIIAHYQQDVRTVRRQERAMDRETYARRRAFRFIDQCQGGYVRIEQV
jgi:hypothetical protein